MKALTLGMLVLVVQSSAASESERALEMTPLGQSLEENGFEKIDERRGVEVYKDNGSDIIRVAAQGVFPGTPDEVFEVLTDYAAQDGAIERVVESRILSRDNASLLVYQHLDLPFISDRDFVLSVTWGREKNTRWVAYHAQNSGAVPVKDGIVRVLVHEGSWQITQAPGGSFVRFQNRIDLSGIFPMWMAKMGAGRELPKLFENLRALLKKRQGR